MNNYYLLIKYYDTFTLNYLYSLHTVTIKHTHLLWIMNF